MVAALGQTVTTVGAMYILRENPFPRIIEHCTMSNLNFRNHCWNSSKRRWEDNIKMDLQEVGCGNMDWIDLAQDGVKWRALVNEVMKLRVP